MSRNSITQRAAIRLILGLTLFVVMLGFMTAMIYQFVLEKADHERAVNLQEFYRARLDQLQNEWELYSRDVRVRIEYTRILENPATATANLQAFLTIQSGDRRYSHLQIRNLDQKVLFTFGKSTLQEFSYDSGQNQFWVYDTATNELYSVYSEPVWLGARGTGRLLLFFPVNHALLGQLAMPGVTLTSFYHARPVANSMGEAGLQQETDHANHNLKEDQHVHWSPSTRDPVSIHIEAPLKPLFTPAELTISVSLVPIIDAIILWFVLGTWLMRNTGRIKKLGDAVKLFSSNSQMTDALHQNLRDARQKDNDEISDVSLAFEHLAQRTVDEDAQRRKTDEELRQHRENLEQLVQTRTADLIKLQSELEHRELLANSIFQTAPVAMLLVDTAGLILRANPQAEAMFMHSSSLTGMHIEMLMPEQFRSNHQMLRTAYNADFTSRRMGLGRDLFALRANGETFPVEVALGPMKLDHSRYVIASIVDVTARKQAENALLNSEATLKRAQAVAHIGSWYLNFAQNELAWSDETYKIFNIPRHTDLSYESFLSRVHPDDRESVDKAWMTALSSGSYEIEHRIIIDNDIKWVRELAHIEFSDSGAPLKGIGTVQDITYIKQAEAALRQAKNDAEAASLAKSTFLANMSHELRTPLNAILGFSQLLSMETNIKPEHRDSLRIIHRSGEHLLALINDILDISKIEVGKITLDNVVMDTTEFMKGINDLFFFRAQSKNLDFFIQAQAGLPVLIIADERKLRQILINLIGNAIKFTQHGKIILRIGCNTDAINPTLAQFWCEVEDSGPGIDASELEHIFEPFQQGKHGNKITEGTGLGLSICKRFIELMQGDITVRSQPGVGSLFRITFAAKLVDDSRVSNREYGIRPTGIASNQPDYRILIVEDNEPNRFVLRQLLTGIGLNIREAENGVEALAIWQQWQPDFIWMDMRMPEMDGYETTRRIRQHEGGHKVKIVALTASAFQQDRQNVLDCGCDDFLCKPYRDADIFNMLNRHLGIRFIYADNALHTQEKPGMEPDKTLNISDIPQHLRTELEQAVMHGNLDNIHSILLKINEHSPDIFRYLNLLAENYAFQKILDQLHAGATPVNPS
jgi:PAS domain S-box-containing protein